MIEIKIEQLLLLPNESTSIKQVNEILDVAILTMDERQRLTIKLIEMHLSLKNYDEVINVGETYFKSYYFDKKFDNDYIFSSIIKASMAIKNYNLAYDYIKIRKEHLPIMHSYLALIDLINFKKITNQPYREEIIEALKDQLPNDVRALLLNELVEIYINTSNENKIIPLISELKAYDSKQSYIPNYLKALFNLGLYDDAIEVANSYVNDEQFQMDAIITLLKVYEIRDEYHKVTILDGDYKNIFELWKPENQLIVYDLFIKIYTRHNHKYSVNIYQKLKNDLLKQLKSKPKAKDDAKVLKELESIYKLPKTNLNHFNSLIDLIYLQSKITNNLKLRDYLRDFFINVEKYKEAIDYIVFTEKDEMLYHYKKNRLYDKTLHKATYENTIISEVLKTGKELFGSFDDFSHLKNIINNNYYNKDILYMYAFPIHDLGVFVIHLKEMVNDPATYYDLYKGINNLIYNILNNALTMSNIKNENYLLNQIYESNLLAFKVLDKNFQAFNNKAQELLNVNSHFPYESFLNNLDIKESMLYQEIINELFQTPNLIKELTYSYKDKQIKEKLISIKDTNEIKIVSYINDLTNEIKDRQSLINDAIIDLETSLPNLNALNNDLPSLLNQKGSLILISFNESILPIYGYDTTLTFFKEFGQITKKIFNEGNLYRFKTYELFLYLPYNDIRTVNNELKKYLAEINNYESKIISYEKFIPKLAVIRYPVVTEEKNPAKLYRYLELTLDYLKRVNPQESYHFFEYDIYEKEIYEQQVIDLLNDAIKNNKLTLSFNQIINKNNYVWKYEAILSMDNLDIDPKYLYQIAKKRNRLFDLEMGHIENIFKYLYNLEQETKQLIMVTIPVSKDTIKNSNFSYQFFEYQKKYQIPSKFISLFITDNNLNVKDILFVLDDLIKNGITLETRNTNVVLNSPFKTLYLDYNNKPRWLNYLKTLNNLLKDENITLVVNEIKSFDEKEKLNNLNIEYIKGTFYKTINSDELFLTIKNLD